LSTTTKRKAKPKAARKAPAKPRTAKKRLTPTKKPLETPSPPPPLKKESLQPEKTYLLAIRLKGEFGTPWSLGTALTTLHLKRKFNAVIVENKPENIGMLRQVKDYVTWGDVNTSDLAMLFRERGEFSGGARVTDDRVKKKFGEATVQDLASALIKGRVSLRALRQGGLNPVFRLRPPSGGFEGTIKRTYSSRGELGNRGPAIAGLLTRMV
jgi:large subunit ribosomal protein L30